VVLADGRVQHVKRNAHKLRPDELSW